MRNKERKEKSKRGMRWWWPELVNKKVLKIINKEYRVNNR
jgi:hypothetical protein